jgi:hypothetical protein
MLVWRGWWVESVIDRLATLQVLEDRFGQLGIVNH